jgi:hypothetical protein
MEKYQNIERSYSLDNYGKDFPISSALLFVRRKEVNRMVCENMRTRSERLTKDLLGRLERGFGEKVEIKGFDFKKINGMETVVVSKKEDNQDLARINYGRGSQRKSVDLTVFGVAIKDSEEFNKLNQIL